MRRGHSVRAWRFAPLRPFASPAPPQVGRSSPSFVRRLDFRAKLLGPLLLAGAAGTAGCRNDGPSSPDVLRAAGGAPGDGAPSARSLREGVRALANEAQRAELSAGGLLIDFGTGDQHKYVQGGWRNGWSQRGADPDAATFAKAAARSLAVRFFLEPVHLPIGAVAMRVRSPEGPRRATVLLDGKPIGNAQVGAGWTTVRLPLGPRRPPPGWHDLTLVFGDPPGRHRADVDWLWLPRSAEAAPAPALTRVAPLALGGSALRALLAPTSRTFAFHLQPPPGAALVFDFGSEGDTLFTVTAVVDGKRRQQIFQDRATPGRWREVVVDLSAFAQQALRLELETEGNTPSGWGDPEIMLPRSLASTRAAQPPAGRPRGVILLVMDTARADVFTPFNTRTRVKTPSFDKLARTSSVFLNAYVNENWTKPSVATILSGLYPSTHGAKREPDVLSKEVALLPEMLQERGFATAAFIANGYCSDKFGFRRGWGTYRNYIRENLPSEAEHVFSDALSWLEANHGRQFFLYLQTIDPHVSYRPPTAQARMYHPEPYRGPLGPTIDGYEQAAISRGKKPVTAADIRWMRALYDGEISYHDVHLGRFLDALAGSRLLDQTLLVITNDHGEEIADHGRYGHGHTLYQELIRSPLLLRYPPVFKADRVHAIVELVDLLPTILEGLGLPPRPDLDGVSLLGTLAGRPPSMPSYALSEFLADQRAVMVGRWKLLAGAGRRRKLFDLVSDPAELIDIAARAPIARRLCEQHLAEALATPAKAARFRDAHAPRRRFETSKVKYDPELQRQLETLGYVGAM
jgi:choline-sulfatase